MLQVLRILSYFTIYLGNKNILRCNQINQACNQSVKIFLITVPIISNPGPFQISKMKL